MFEFLFSQYKDYSTIDIVLEVITIIFGLISVFFAKKNNILVYPTGIVNTAIYVYLLWKWSLLGDMMINVYLFIMSIYGWVNWALKKENVFIYPISKTSKKEYLISLILFIATILFVVGVYLYFDKFTHWTNYLDTLVTGLIFVGMWLMAKRKIENWIFLIIADLISIPMYFAKGYTFSSIFYLSLSIIAYFGYKEWRTYLQQETLSK